MKIIFITVTIILSYLCCFLALAVIKWNNFRKIWKSVLFKFFLIFMQTHLQQKYLILCKWREKNCLRWNHNDEVDDDADGNEVGFGCHRLRGMSCISLVFVYFFKHAWVWVGYGYGELSQWSQRTQEGRSFIFFFFKTTTTKEQNCNSKIYLFLFLQKNAYNIMLKR